MANELKEKEKLPFSVVLHSDAMKNLINNTLGDTNVSRQFVADISAVVANKEICTYEY